MFSLYNYNIKGIQNNSRRLSVNEYFKNKLVNNGILFLHKTHSTFNDDNSWKNDFNVPALYSQGTFQSCVSLLLILEISTFRLTNKWEIKMDVFLFLK